MNRWLKSMILCLVLCAAFLFSHGHLMVLGCVILAITAVFCLIMLSHNENQRQIGEEQFLA